jgi:hypothetical protein
MKHGNLKNGAQRWLRFSQLLIPCEKTQRDIIFLHPRMEKNLSPFLKIPFDLLEISLSEDRWSNWTKNGFLIFGEGGFGGE